MRGTLLRNASLYTQNLLLRSHSTTLAASTRSSLSFFCLFSSSGKTNNQSNPNPAPDTTKLPQPVNKDVALDVEDVDNKELKRRIESYFKGDEQALPSIIEAILQRQLTGKHEQTDDLQ